jgi:alpha/beta superfamily hydrolase
MMIRRRQFLKTALAAGAAASLSGCEELIRVLGQACPPEGESPLVDWTPDVLHPVSQGFQDLSAADGAPGTVRVWYPSAEVFPDGSGPRRILKMCLQRWPVVLFLHGQPPCPDANYYRRWTRLPAVLARSGYVVVVPSHTATLTTGVESPNVANALSFLDWVRSGWQDSKWVDKRPEATAVAGHSFGALLAAFVKQARPQISAFVGLSGVWTELGNPVLSVLEAIGAPSFFMWGDERDRLDVGGLWDHVQAPKHGAFFPGMHFDYLTPWTGCSFLRGSCTLIEPVAAELAALFITRYMPVNLSLAHIPVTLDPPNVTLTPKQQFFGAAGLTGLQDIKTRAGCSVDLRWEDGSSGSRHLGP